MPTYTDEKIIVSFDPFEKVEQMNLQHFKFCAVCKQLQDVEQYKSLFKKRQCNKICRRCLNQSAELKKLWCFNKGVRQINRKKYLKNFFKKIYLKKYFL